MTTTVDDLQPRMLAPTQIEAHVSRLQAVREGLRKFEKDDGRAVECSRILEVAINMLNAEPFPTVPVEVPEEQPPGPETIEQVQARERAPGGAAAPADLPRFTVDTDPPSDEPDEPQRPTTGHGSERGIV